METIDFDKSTHTKTCTKSDLPKKTPLFDGRATRSQHQIFDPFLAVFTNSHVYPGLYVSEGPGLILLSNFCASLKGIQQTIKKLQAEVCLHRLKCTENPSALWVNFRK